METKVKTGKLINSVGFSSTTGTISKHKQAKFILSSNGKILKYNKKFKRFL